MVEEKSNWLINPKYENKDLANWAKARLYAKLGHKLKSGKTDSAPELIEEFYDDSEFYDIEKAATGLESVEGENEKGDKKWGIKCNNPDYERLVYRNMNVGKLNATDDGLIANDDNNEGIPVISTSVGGPALIPLLLPFIFNFALALVLIGGGIYILKKCLNRENIDSIGIKIFKLVDIVVTFKGSNVRNWDDLSEDQKTLVREIVTDSGNTEQLEQRLKQSVEMN